MDKVSKTAAADVDRVLDRLMCEWERLPEVESEIGRWDWLDQIVFIEEWPIQEDALADIARHAAAGALTTTQLGRYEELKRVVARNRPIIQRLQNS